MSLPKLHIQNATNSSCPDLKGQGYSASFHTHSSARGPRKKIYHGHLDGSGPRKGEHAVVKVFRDKPGTEELIDREIEKHRLARKLAARFNKLLADDRTRIRFTLPLKSTVDNIGLGTYLHRHTVRSLGKSEWVLMEENLLHQGEYQVFINRRGERLKNEPTSLDAFMHFTYHESEGLFLMCGFQGIHTAKGYTLTTPCLHSTDHSFGHTVDKGHRGIRMVFRHHQCNNICYGFLRPDLSKMAAADDSSDSDAEEREEVEELPREADDVGEMNVAMDVVAKETKMNRTKKVDVLGIPKEETEDNVNDLPRVSSDPGNCVDLQFKNDSASGSQEVKVKDGDGKEEKKKKKKKQYRSNVKMLTTIFKKRPSF